MNKYISLLLLNCSLSVGCYYSVDTYLEENPQLDERQRALVREYGAPRHPSWTWLIFLNDRCNEEMNKEPALDWDAKFWIWHGKQLPIGVSKEVVEWCRGVTCRHTYQHMSAYAYSEICDDGQLYYHFRNGKLSGITKL